MAMKYDPINNAFYDDSDPAIKLQGWAYAPTSGNPGGNGWLLIGALLLLLLAAKKRQ